MKLLLSFLLSLVVMQVCYSNDIDIEAIIQIESSGNPHAYNEKSGAIGLMQITPICLLDYNESLGGYNLIHIIPITIEQLYNPTINVKIGTWYINKRIPEMLKYYEIEDTVENRLWAYNAGIGNVVKGIKPKETRNNIKKYRRLINEK